MARNGSAAEDWFNLVQKVLHSFNISGFVIILKCLYLNFWLTRNFVEIWRASLNNSHDYEMFYGDSSGYQNILPNCLKNLEIKAKKVLDLVNTA